MPARLRDIKRALAKHGIDVVEAKKGSHWKCVRGATTYPIPAHNGLREEISDVYIRALCKCFDLDYRAFVREL